MSRIQSLSFNFTKTNSKGQLICNCKCPGCIAKATWKTGVLNNDLIVLNTNKALNYAVMHGVDTVIMTGSTEPTICPEYLSTICRCKAANIPAIEVQTNGIEMAKNNYDLLKKSHQAGLTLLAISIHHINPIQNNRLIGIPETAFNYIDLIKEAHKLGGLMVRVSLNLNYNCFYEAGEDWGPYTKVATHPFIKQLFVPWLKKMKRYGVDQITLRTMGKALNPLKTPEALAVGEWVDKFAFNPDLKNLINTFLTNDRFPALRQLYYGPYVRNVYGLMMVDATCKEERAEDEDSIRSLILQPDGLLHTSWDYASPII